MIIKIELKRKGKAPLIVLTGNSHHSWQHSLGEYFRGKIDKENYQEFSLGKVKVSRSRWPKWGGLKLCTENAIQDYLNREGCQVGEPDRKTPRQYVNMQFQEDNEKWFDVFQILKERTRQCREISKAKED